MAGPPESVLFTQYFFHVKHPWMCHDKSKRALVVQRKSFELEHFLCEWKSLKGRIRTSTLNGIRENASEITHTSIPTAFCIYAHNSIDRMRAQFWRTSEYLFQLR